MLLHLAFPKVVMNAGALSSFYNRYGDEIETVLIDPQNHHIVITFGCPIAVAGAYIVLPVFHLQ